MKSHQLIVAAAILCAAVAAHDAAAAGAPADATGVCKDGSYSMSADKKGACRGHKGVKDWYAAVGAATPTSDLPSTGKAAAAAAAAGTVTAAGTAKAGVPKPATNAAPGGGPGMVWANVETKVYHCQGDEWYGKTKMGEYLSEAAAKTKGMHASHGKACGA